MTGREVVSPVSRTEGRREATSGMRGAQLTWVNTPSERREKLEVGITTSGTNCQLVMSDLGRSLYLSSFLKHKNGKNLHTCRTVEKNEVD